MAFWPLKHYSNRQSEILSAILTYLWVLYCTHSCLINVLALRKGCSLAIELVLLS
jgi:hypothetical protein